ncbi:MAG: phosphatidylserine/phosphatidylglycerophosphate/cardiolipin synthase family protein [Bacteriovoracaceae bacterium]|nr:phosphatidylserine/phosphatidylglycerophosphate/cardiolipin synthase family protein [Bacteriovoracaceae bacterium]
MIFRAFFTSIFLGLSLHTSAQEIFLPERGQYKFDIQQIAESYQAKSLSYLTFNPERAQASAKYKLNKRGEYQIKDWYLQDWHQLQKIFTLNVEEYIQHFGATTFNEAKRLSFGKLKFSKKTLLHKKLIPIMKEWGGLNHPPLNSLTLPIEKYSAKHGEAKKMNRSFFDPQFHQNIDEVSHSELSFGNKLQILEDRQSFETKKNLIRKAQKTILMSSLVFVCDKGTSELVDLLIKRHNEGIDVRVMADATISKFLKHRDCLLKLKDSGVEVIEADDFWKHKGRAIYHTKNLVVDFKQGIVGGHNMIDADNLSLGTNFMNRDIDILVTGPMVTDMSIGFLEDWQHFVEKRVRPGVTSAHHYLEESFAQKKREYTQKLRGASNYASILSNPVTQMKGVCRFIKQSPYQDGNSIGKAYLKILDSVKDYLIITNPIASDGVVTKWNRAWLPPIEIADHFEMYNQLYKKIQSLAKNGLKVDYLTTNIDMAGNENVAIYNERIQEDQLQGHDFAANMNLLKIYLSNTYYGTNHYKQLLNKWITIPSVNVWTHISFLHSKVMHFDRQMASIGSYNLQHNATDHAFEVTTICQDESLNDQLDKVLVLDMANSIPLVFKP